MQPFGKLFDNISSKFKTHIFDDPAILVLTMLPTSRLAKSICTRIFVEDYM